MTRRSGRGSGDPVLSALDDLMAALTDCRATAAAAEQRVQHIRSLRNDGLGYRSIADEAGRPLIVEVVSADIERLQRTAAALRRAHAAALHAEGLTMEQIAGLFGVTRQRIGAILRDEQA